jgi:DNA-binding CsgD family transcriptional regulator
LIALAATVAEENGAAVFGRRPQYLADRARMQASFPSQMSELPAQMRPVLLTSAWRRTADGFPAQPDRPADLIEPGPGKRAGLLEMSPSALTLADPLRVDESVLAQLDRAVDAIGAERDPARIVAIGAASFYTDRLTDCTDALQRVVRGGTGAVDAGAQTSVPAALLLLCFDAMHSGRWDAAERSATQVIGLCESGGARPNAWTARYALSLLAALRGQEDRAQTLTEETTTWPAPSGIHAKDVGLQHARALAAIGRGDFEEGFRRASVVSPPGRVDGHNPQCLWLIMDLVEAAVRTGRLAAATDHVEAARERRVARVSGRFALLVAGAAAMAAPGRSAAPMFEEALALPRTDQWPFEVARIHLAFGERLRRERSITRARWHLTAASAAFDQLGAQPWMRRASAELRATGLTRVLVHSGGPASLTPQEREVAELAATGMTNKQIGAQLYLSHRTVAAHLYRVFPKLAVTTRAALRDALSA